MRADWTKPYYDQRIDLSANICHDIYNIKFKLDLTKYNDPFYSYKILSEFYNIDIKNIAIGLGLSELITRLFIFIKNQNMSLTIIGEPTWQLTTLLQAEYNVPQGNDFVYVASPNGNTGDIENIQSLLKQYKYIILDEAYGDFYKEDVTFSDRVITLKTLSKSYALPGVRFGYMFGDNGITNEIQRIRPGHVTIGNIDDYLPFILNDIKNHVERMNETKKYLIDNNYCSYSYTNFVLVNDTSIFNNNFKLKSNRLALTNLEIVKKCLKKN